LGVKGVVWQSACGSRRTRGRVVREVADDAIKERANRLSIRARPVPIAKKERRNLKKEGYARVSTQKQGMFRVCFINHLSI
jgi:hypothetical protein